MRSLTSEYALYRIPHQILSYNPGALALEPLASLGARPPDHISGPAATTETRDFAEASKLCARVKLGAHGSGDA
jgi:hypothetical protein